MSHQDAASLRGWHRPHNELPVHPAGGRLSCSVARHRSCASFRAPSHENARCCGRSSVWVLAERRGFEPRTPCGEHAFQACALSHSAISPSSRPRPENGGARYRKFREECAPCGQIVHPIRGQSGLRSPRRSARRPERTAAGSLWVARRCISFVRAASVVMSPPGTTPTSRSMWPVA